MRAQNKTMTRGMTTPSGLTEEERYAKIEKLLLRTGVAFRRFWKTEPEEEFEVPKHEKPAELKRLAARLRAGVTPQDVVSATPEQLEAYVRFEKRGIWFHKKLREYGEILQPLYAELEALEQSREQTAFHETKSLVTADPASSMDESFLTMKRAFRETVGRRRDRR